MCITGRQGKGMGGEHRKGANKANSEEQTIETKKEKIFIIGGGTSAQQVIDDGYLYDYIHNYTVMCCNKAVEYFYADYLVYHDLKFSEEFSHLLDSFNGQIYAPYPASINRYRARDNVNYIKHSQNICFDLNRGLNTGNNCGVTALALAAALGFKDIYLVGMDGRFNESKTQSHFHGGYGHDLSPRAYDSFSYFFEKTGEALAKELPDVKVYNCSYISLIDTEQKYFERIDLSEHFSK